MFAEATTEKELLDLLAMAGARDVPVFVLGGGSNVVVADQGFPGLVIHMAMTGIRVQDDGARVQLHAAAGEQLDAIVARAVAEHWAGLECLSGIPGLVGATPIQNVGAYGQEVSETVVAVRAYDRQSGQFVLLSRDDCRFAYRSSVFRGASRFVVTAVQLSLDRSDASRPVRYAELARALGVRTGATAPLALVRDTVLGLRRSKGMVCDPADPESFSAGSFFVNPVLTEAQRDALEGRLRSQGQLAADDAMPGFAAGDGAWKVPAAWLIEHAGFSKGTSRGGVGVSKRHALALVNRGGTTDALLAFEAEIRAAVRERFGVELQREPVVVGG